MNYDENFLQKQRSVKVWIEYILNINLGDVYILDALRDGRLLCKTMNSFHDRMDFIHYSNVVPVTAFKRQDNINLFLKKARLYLPQESLFNINDLEKNEKPEQVLDCLIKLSEHFIQNRIAHGNKNEDGSNENGVAPEDNYYNNNGNNVNNINLNTSSSSSSSVTTNTHQFIDENDYQYQLQLQQYQQQEQYQQAQQQYQQAQQQEQHPQQQINNNNSNSNKSIYKKKKKGMNGHILDCILEVKHYVLVPLFISVAAGFGIKMGRSIFINMIEFKYSLLFSNISKLFSTQILNRVLSLPKLIIPSNIDFNSYYQQIPKLITTSIDYIKSIIISSSTANK